MLTSHLGSCVIKIATASAKKFVFIPTLVKKMNKNHNINTNWM